MNDAMDIITEKLVSTGMKRIEADHLLARFLQEEAFQYVEYISSHLGDMLRNGEEEKPILLS